MGVEDECDVHPFILLIDMPYITATPLSAEIHPCTLLRLALPGSRLDKC